MRSFILLSAATAALCSPAFAGKFNRKLDVGDASPAFKKLTGVDGKTHSLADYRKAKAIVVVFTCNHCPVAKAYEARLKSFVQDYTKKGAVLLAINCNTSDADKLDAMKKRAKAEGFNFDYLYDPQQTVGKAFGALVTPHAFVLDSKRRIAYMGAFDDSMNPAKIERHYVRNAVDSLLAGKKPEVSETRQFGCGIQYKR